MTKSVSKKKPAGRATVAAKVGGGVDDFMAALEHPLKAEIETTRRVILGVSPVIEEAIKWNAPSFRTREFFATTNLRSRDRVQLIFHLGAKVRADLPELRIADPSGLIQWLGRDRCLVTVGTGSELAKNRAALEAIVRQWIDYV